MKLATEEVGTEILLLLTTSTVRILQVDVK